MKTLSQQPNHCIVFHFVSSLSSLSSQCNYKLLVIKKPDIHHTIWNSPNLYKCIKLICKVLPLIPPSINFDFTFYLSHQTFSVCKGHYLNYLLVEELLKCRQSSKFPKQLQKAIQMQFGLDFSLNFQCIQLSYKPK